MRLVVHADSLAGAAAAVAADSAVLDALALAARLDAAADAVPGTTSAMEARAAAAGLRLAVFQLQLQLAAYATQIGAAAQLYRETDAVAVPPSEQQP